MLNYEFINRPPQVGRLGRMKRRHVLKTIGIASTITLGYPRLVRASTSELVQRIRDDGSYRVRGNPTNQTVYPFIRANHPLRRETENGGILHVHPAQNGIRASIDLDPEDGLCSSGFTLERIRLGDIGTITIDTNSNPCTFGLFINTPGTDNEIFTWTEGRGDTERCTGLGGDVVAIGGVLGPGTTIDRDHEFLVRSESGVFETVTIDDFDSDIEARVAVGAASTGTGEALPADHEVTITDVTIDPPP